MENIIEVVYRKATKGLSEDLLKNSSQWYNYVLNLPITDQVIYTTVLFHSQIENGGFHQYFFNSYGQFCFLTLKNLEIIGSSKRHDLLQRAFLFVNYRRLNEEKFRESVINRKIGRLSNFDEDLFDQLSELDNEYYDLEDEDVYSLLENYIHSR